MKKITSLILVLIIAVSLCACGSSSKYSDQSSEMVAEAPAAAEAPMMFAGVTAADYAADNGFGMVEEERGYEAKSKAESEADTPEVDPEKIIYSADATVETTEFDESIAALNKLIEDCGGWVESSSMEGANYYNTSRGKVSNRCAYYTLRIPADRFQSVMGTLSTLGNVPYTHTYTENVTAQYYDVKARLTAYEAQETRLIEMLEIAETVEDIITIEEKLTDVRYMIDSMQSSLNNWDRRVSYSSLSLTVQEVQVYTPQTVTKLSYGQELKNAFTDALRNSGQFFKDLLVFLVSALPAIVILAVLFFALRIPVKKLIARRKEKKGKNKQE